MDRDDPVGKEMVAGGEWTVVRKLAQHLSTVQLVRHRTLCIPAVVKTYSSERARKDPELQAALSAEYDAEVELLDIVSGHPGIVRLLEHGRDRDGIGYIVYEYASHGDLWTYFVGLRRGAYRTELARFYFRRMLDVIAHLHALGIAHGDVKPENFLVGADMRLKATDFGCATPLGQRGGERYGTYAYMAPEVYERRPHRPERADVFSLGVSLLYLACDISWLHPGSRDHEIFRRRGPTSSFFVESDSFSELVTGMLRDDPERRMSLSEVQSSAWIKEL